MNKLDPNIGNIEKFELIREVREELKAKKKLDLDTIISTPYEERTTEQREVLKEALRRANKSVT
ncbi:hypothetical protein LCGC14_1490020 [marine sediment metagenome]|uniref:Uncharacterized protein n=1 Tax=marine sediment metagenome TaxID=412755 RepID=A0A0F9M8T0_9ZZZZ